MVTAVAIQNYNNKIQLHINSFIPTFSRGFQKLLLTRIKTIVLLTTDFQNPK